MTVAAAVRPTGTADGRPAIPAGGVGRGCVVLGVVSGALFGLLTLVLVRTRLLNPGDRAGSLHARSWAAGHPGSPLGGLVHLGDGSSIVVVAVLVGATASLSLRRWRPLLGTAATLVLLVVLVEGSKMLLGRIPPTLSGQWSNTFFTASSTSFPSGHTAGTLVTLLLVASLIAGPGGMRPAPVAYRLIAAGAIVAGLAVGALTVTLGWHWPSDVVGGALLAGVAIAVGRALIHRPLD